MFTFQAMAAKYLKNKSNTVIRPQAGPQEQFLSTSADIAIYGGAAGGGKTWALLVEPLRHVSNGKFRCVCFRRTTKQIRVSGGLWDKSGDIYRPLAGTSKETTLEWVFKSGMKIQYAHLEQESNIYDWQGSEIPLIMFDELTHFTAKQFFYLLGRNRSLSGITGYIRATCNPEKKSWVRVFIDWWIDKKTGFPIKERSGILRWFIRDGDSFIWGDSKDDLKKQYGDDCLPKSVTFIYAKIYDNQILLKKDPGYLANLKALSRIDREQLLDGNWNVEPSAGMFFRKSWFEIIDGYSAQGIRKIVRCWDRAATEVREGDSEAESKNPDWTAGVKLAQMKDGTFLILDIIRERISSLKVQNLTLRTAKNDGVGVTVKIFQDPGSAGVYESDNYIRLLAGFNIVKEKIMVNKQTAAKPASAQAEAGNIKILKGPWNDDFLNEIQNFPEGHDDQVDAFTGAFNYLTSENVGDFTNDFVQNGDKNADSTSVKQKW